MALDVPPGYRALKEADVAAYLADVPAVATNLGGKAAEWKVREVGDGNLNLVVRGRRAQERRGAEAGAALCPAGRRELAPVGAPRLLRAPGAPSPRRGGAGARAQSSSISTRRLALTVMAYLKPHIILRKGLIRGTVYPRLADHMATFMAETLFSTSDLGQPAAAKKKQMALFCGNIELCRITEDLVFTDPWRVAEANRWTSPQLDRHGGGGARRRAVEAGGAGAAS